MTNEEAISVLEEQSNFYRGFQHYFESKSVEISVEKLNAPKLAADRYRKLADAFDAGIAALRRIEWEDTIWHDAETDPPRTPGLYYGKKDDTNSMYAVNYRDGVWTLDSYPDHKMQIIQWTNYGAFGREENDE